MRTLWRSCLIPVFLALRIRMIFWGSFQGSIRTRHLASHADSSFKEHLVISAVLRATPVSNFAHHAEYAPKFTSCATSSPSKTSQQTDSTVRTSSPVTAANRKKPYKKKAWCYATPALSRSAWTVWRRQTHYGTRWSNNDLLMPTSYIINDESELNITRRAGGIV